MTEATIASREAIRSSADGAGPSPFQRARAHVLLGGRRREPRRAPGRRARRRHRRALAAPPTRRPRLGQPSVERRAWPRLLLRLGRVDDRLHERAPRAGSMLLDAPDRLRPPRGVVRGHDLALRLLQDDLRVSAREDHRRGDRQARVGRRRRAQRATPSPARRRRRTGWSGRGSIPCAPWCRIPSAGRELGSGRASRGRGGPAPRRDRRASRPGEPRRGSRGAGRR